MDQKKRMKPFCLTFQDLCCLVAFIMSGEQLQEVPYTAIKNAKALVTCLFELAIISN